MLCQFKADHFVNKIFYSYLPFEKKKKKKKIDAMLYDMMLANKYEIIRSLFQIWEMATLMNFVNFIVYAINC